MNTSFIICITIQHVKSFGNGFLLYWKIGVKVHLCMLSHCLPNLPMLFIFSRKYQILLETYNLFTCDDRGWTPGCFYSVINVLIGSVALGASIVLPWWLDARKVTSKSSFLRRVHGLLGNTGVLGCPGVMLYIGNDAIAIGNTYELTCCVDVFKENNNCLRHECLRSSESNFSTVNEHWINK